MEERDGDQQKKKNGQGRGDITGDDVNKKNKEVLTDSQFVSSREVPES